MYYSAIFLRVFVFLIVLDNCEVFLSFGFQIEASVIVHHIDDTVEEGPTKRYKFFWNYQVLPKELLVMIIVKKLYRRTTQKYLRPLNLSF